MNGIQYIWKSKFHNTEPVRSINQNSGNGDNRMHLSPLKSPSESLDSDHIQTTFMLSLIIKTIYNFFITILNKIYSLKGLFPFL